jgi:hypothetical protein
MCNWRLNVYYRSHFYPYCVKIGRMLNIYYKVFISFEVTALAIAALNQVVSGCKTAV